MELKIQPLFLCVVLLCLTLNIATVNSLDKGHNKVVDSYKQAHM
jgi:hypothetical protein